MSDHTKLSFNQTSQTIGQSSAIIEDFNKKDKRP